MDEITLQAMAKWPSVPDVFGWLSLDRRGRWAIKGETLTRRSLVDLIGRNYAADEHGRWFFQNGPQRVFVELAYLPLVLHWEAGREAGRLATHTGSAVKQLSAAYLDEEGALLLVCEHGPGLLLDTDLERALAEHLRDVDGHAISETALLAALAEPSGCPTRLRFSYESREVELGRLDRAAVPGALGFERTPAARLPATSR